MELLLIRHLPTKWNKMGILQGSQDVPLLQVTEEDIKKIKENMKVIHDFKPELVLASQLKRTKQTAVEYGFNHLQIEPLLNELNFGKYEGTEKKQLMLKKEWTENPRSLILGENMIDFENRIIQFINKYNHYSRILVFGHGSWTRGLLSIINIGTIQKMNQVHVENNQLISLILNKHYTELTFHNSTDA